MSGVHTNTVSELIGEVEAALVRLDESLVILDTVEGVETHPQALADRGVFVEVPSTDPTDDLRNSTVQLDVDALRVTLLVQLTHADGQKNRRTEALRLEEQIRHAVLAIEATVGTGWRLARGAVTRGPHPRSPGWWRTVQTFRVERYQDLMGGQS
jgi:hypothetical protein